LRLRIATKLAAQHELKLVAIEFVLTKHLEKKKKNQTRKIHSHLYMAKQLTAHHQLKLIATASALTENPKKKKKKKKQDPFVPLKSKKAPPAS